VNLEILCSMFLDEKTANSSLHTLTSLYEEMMSSILRRYVKEKREKEPAERLQGLISQLQFQEKVILYLEELAFTAMQRQSLIFCPSETLPEGLSADDEVAFLKEVFKLGFSKTTKQAERKFKEEHYFFHLTIQEFFAARYLA